MWLKSNSKEKPGSLCIRGSQETTWIARGMPALNCFAIAKIKESLSRSLHQFTSNIVWIRIKASLTPSFIFDLAWNFAAQASPRRFRAISPAKIWPSTRNPTRNLARYRFFVDGKWFIGENRARNHKNRCRISAAYLDSRVDWFVTRMAELLTSFRRISSHGELVIIHEDATGNWLRHFFSIFVKLISSFAVMHQLRGLGHRKFSFYADISPLKFALLSEISDSDSSHPTAGNRNSYLCVSLFLSVLLFIFE